MRNCDEDELLAIYQQFSDEKEFEKLKRKFRAEHCNGCNAIDTCEWRWKKEKEEA